MKIKYLSIFLLIAFLPLVLAGDWVNVTEQDIRTNGENSSAVHTLSTQYIINETELQATNNGTVNFASVDISSVCENGDTSPAINTGTAQVSSNCSTVQRTVDTLTESLSSSWIEDPSVTCQTDGNCGITKSQLNVTHNGSIQVNFTDVNATPSLSSRAGWTCAEKLGLFNITNGSTSNFNYPINCTKSNVLTESADINSATAYSLINSSVIVNEDVWYTVNTTINNTDSDISFSSYTANLTDQIPKSDLSRWSNQSARVLTGQSISNGSLAYLQFNISGIAIDRYNSTQFSCSAGFTKFDNFCKKTTVISGGNRYNYEFFTNATSNVSKNNEIRFTYPQSQFTSWASSSAVSVDVDDSAVGVTVEQDAEDVIWIVATSHSGSYSLAEGEHNFSIQYDVVSSGGGGGGGGGGGSTQIIVVNQTANEAVFDARIQREQLIVPIGTASSVSDTIILENLIAEDITVEMIITENGTACEYLTLGGNGVKGQNFDIKKASGGQSQRAFISIQADVPLGLDEGERNCQFQFTAKSQQIVLDVPFQFKSQQSIIDLIFEFLQTEILRISLDPSQLSAISGDDTPDVEKTPITVAHVFVPILGLGAIYIAYSRFTEGKVLRKAFQRLK